jgi:hypothetical protein
MFLAKWALNRIEPRVQVLPVELRGLLALRETVEERQVPFIVWDVSANGLGIILSDRLAPGDVLRLTFGPPCALVVMCSVVWCELQEADYDFQEPSYRCGLITIQGGKPLQPIIDTIEEQQKQSTNRTK